MSKGECTPEPAAESANPAAVRREPWVELKQVRWGPIQLRASIAAASTGALPGDIADAYGPDGAWVGRGFYNPQSRYAFRFLTRDDEPVDGAWLARKLDRAVALRREVLRLEESTDAYRVVHGEGDGLSGLIADKLGDVVSLELFSRGFWDRLEHIAPPLMNALGCSSGIARMDRRIVEAEGISDSGGTDPAAGRWFGWEASAGAREPSPVVAENGVRFRVRFGLAHGGHKTGFFCDQRENRLRLAGLVRGRSVLDVCCYTGGFACYAARLGGASLVTAIDLDENALALARENVNLNQVRVTLVHADAFSYLRQMERNGQRFGCVVLDPPKFVGAPSELREGCQRYIDLNKLALRVLEPGGVLLTCSCSGLVGRSEFVKLVCDAALFAGKKLQLLAVTGAGPDHPVMSDYPEGAYLKAVWARPQ